nr:MAG TPA: hypothetical protein [Caudoviricetes sp.]
MNHISIGRISSHSNAIFLSRKSVIFHDETAGISSTPIASTRWTLHEHLLFQRRLRRKGVAVMSKQKSRVKALVCLDPRFLDVY